MRRSRPADGLARPPSASLWSATADLPGFPSLQGDVRVDVAVVGAGITGVTTAFLLKEEGKTVALVDLGRIGHGTTGSTTAKLTVGQNLLYARLASSHGEEAARLYAESNQAAIATMGELVARLELDCGWEAASNYVYTESSGRLDEFRAEAEAMRRAGIAAELTRDTELPFPVAEAIRVDGQAQFHPLRYLGALAARLPGAGSHVFERTRATAVRGTGPRTVETQGGRIVARDVVLATQLPFLDRGLFFARAHPLKSYAVAAEVDGAGVPLGMYISADEPTRSVRSAPAVSGARQLIVGGESHRPGEEPHTERRYRALEEFMREHFGAEADLRWSAHDYMPADGLPYIGRLRRGDGHVYVATGFAKWGLTKATIAARIVTDEIAGRPSPWARLYDSTRIAPRASAASVVSENAHVARRFVLDRVRPRPGADDVGRLARGEGAIVRTSGRHNAVYRDDAGILHVLSARCPHLGCLVGWNEADRTWECPCHGSRFDAEGGLLQGPATEDLERRPGDG